MTPSAAKEQGKVRDQGVLATEKVRESRGILQSYLEN